MNRIINFNNHFQHPEWNDFSGYLSSYTYGYQATCTLIDV